MDDRTMPLATFRCDVCGEQETLRLTRHHRDEGRDDVTRPHPRHDRQPMRLVQLQYADTVAAS